MVTSFSSSSPFESGSFGEVVRAIHLPTNEIRAVKIVDKKKIEKHEILMQLQQQEFFVLMETVSIPYNVITSRTTLI